MSSTSSTEQAATIAALLAASGRTGQAVPLRRTFVQQGDQKNPQPGPLRKIVAHQDERALDLYLLLAATASKEPWDVTRDARVWARALGRQGDRDQGRSLVSKAWRRLDKTYNLVDRSRSGRLAAITLLEESGMRDAYTSPEARYFKLPYAYWLDDKRWYATLSLPAKATLLIALSLKQPFVLPAERAEAWYGISADTLDRGLRELQKVEVLDRNATTTNNYLTGNIRETHYDFTLLPPFWSGTKKTTSNTKTKTKTTSNTKTKTTSNTKTKVRKEVPS